MEKAHFEQNYYPSPEAQLDIVHARVAIEEINQEIKESLKHLKETFGHMRELEKELRNLRSVRGKYPEGDASSEAEGIGARSSEEVERDIEQARVSAEDVLRAIECLDEMAMSYEDLIQRLEALEVPKNKLLELTAKWPKIEA